MKIAHRWHRALEPQIAARDQPIVEAESAQHGLSAVVGNHQHVTVGRRESQRERQLGIEQPVVVEHHTAVAMSGPVARMGRIAVTIKKVVQAIGPHVHHHQEIAAARSAERAK